MLIITKIDHIMKLHQSGKLPRFGLHYLMSQYLDFAAGLNHSTPPDDFSLEEHSYQMVVLERDDADCVLPIVSLFGTKPILTESHPEYVELVELSDDHSMYRICYMPDNECFLMFYVAKGSMDADVERWLAEQAGYPVEEGVQ
ncbi:hypothetical protein EYB31_18280 [Paenibacillus thalictri]|uniref:Uncharacterized protein n=1 Tax=Paenibacillus thalictri TaxID=2527873 RepID=A0A4Q9DN90_9BACL|nr:hypothetical protein EYB31_18280 [Paenibacillus thalictri]